MSWLYEKIDAAKQFGAYKEIPQFVKDNLNQNFEVRPYQEDALRNFITYYENPVMYTGKNIHTLFHSKIFLFPLPTDSLKAFCLYTCYLHPAFVIF